MKIGSKKEPAASRQERTGRQERTERAGATGHRSKAESQERPQQDTFTRSKAPLVQLDGRPPVKSALPQQDRTAQPSTPQQQSRAVQSSTPQQNRAVAPTSTQQVAYTAQSTPAAGAGQAQGTQGTQGTQAAQAAQPFPGTNAKGDFAHVFDSFQVTKDASIPSRIGAHWGPSTDYSAVMSTPEGRAKVDKVLDEMKKAGIGYSVVIVDSAHPEKQIDLLKAMKDKGIEPVIRLLPPDDPQTGRSGYNRTMNELSSKDIDTMVAGAKKLKEAGMTFIQLDNEPNVDEGGKTLWKTLRDGALAPPGSPENEKYKTELGKYAANLAETMRRINAPEPEGTGGMTIGFGTVVPGAEYKGEGQAGRSPSDPRYDDVSKQFFGDLMHHMKYHDKNSQPPGSLLNNTWLGVHPYTTGSFMDEKQQVRDGLPQTDWYRDTARIILERPDLKTLATEGGSRLSQAGASQSILNQHQMALMPQGAEYTQCFWLISDGFLEPTGNWNDALIDSEGRPGAFLQDLQKIAQGEKTTL